MDPRQPNHGLPNGYPQQIQPSLFASQGDESLPPMTSRPPSSATPYLHATVDMPVPHAEHTRTLPHMTRSNPPASSSLAAIMDAPMDAPAVAPIAQQMPGSRALSLPAVSIAQRMDVPAASPVADPMALLAAASMATSDATSIAPTAARSMSPPTHRSMAPFTSRSSAQPAPRPMLPPVPHSIAPPGTWRIDRPEAYPMVPPRFQQMDPLPPYSMGPSINPSIASPQAQSMPLPGAHLRALPGPYSMFPPGSHSLALPGSHSLALLGAHYLAPIGARSMAPSIAQSMAPPVAQSMAPPVAQSMAPPVAQSMAPPVAQSMAPPVSHSTTQSMAPPVAQSMAPRVVIPRDASMGHSASVPTTAANAPSSVHSSGFGAMQNPMTGSNQAASSIPARHQRIHQPFLFDCSVPSVIDNELSSPYFDRFLDRRRQPSSRVFQPRDRRDNHVPNDQAASRTTSALGLTGLFRDSHPQNRTGELEPGMHQGYPLPYNPRHSFNPLSRVPPHLPGYASQMLDVLVPYDPTQVYTQGPSLRPEFNPVLIEEPDTSSEEENDKGMAEDQPSAATNLE